jgi:orotate phosphoribosyltransferase
MKKTNESLRGQLYEIIKRDAFFKKKVILASGKESNYYLDIRRVSLSSDGVYLIAHLIWDILKKNKISAFGGPTLGADSIVGAVCFLARQEGRSLKGFLVRKEPKKHGRQNLIEGKELTKKDRIVLVDDVATSGGSFVRSIEALKKDGFKVLKAVSVIDRQEGAIQALEKAGCPLVSLFTAMDFLNPPR